jgi:hypothetical protein
MFSYPYHGGAAGSTVFPLAGLAGPPQFSGKTFHRVAFPCITLPFRTFSYSLQKKNTVRMACQRPTI